MAFRRRPAQVRAAKGRPSFGDGLAGARCPRLDDGVTDCRVLVVEPHERLAYNWNAVSGWQRFVGGLD